MIGILLALACLVYQADCGTQAPTTPTTTMNPMDVQMGDIRQTVEGLSRQMVMQQLGVEERIRSDGDSGIKQKIVKNRGTRPYLNDIVSSPNLADFSEFWTRERVLGIGTNVFVMNGVEFRLQRQNYNLVMPSRTSKDWHKTEDIPYPEVPHSVLAKHNVTEQIDEMREYFRAFKNQDTKIRSDYARYFKPVLCYLEGAWLDGAAHSQGRWMNEAMYIEYTANDGLEDGHSYNPTKIMKVINGTAVYAHWASRILCHPIKQELPLASFYVKDDLAARLSASQSLYDFSRSRAARFALSEYGKPSRKFYPEVGYGKMDPTFNSYTTLDSIMEEIPGTDNYPVHITGGSFGLTAFNAHFPRNNTELNLGHYHHWYRVLQKGAMGTTVINRGYADRSLWVAASEQDHLAPMTYNSCHYDRKTHKQNCTEYVAKYTYALPLEIVWMTPLLSWNPYNLQHFEGDIHKSPANTISAHGHNGRTPEKAFLGTNHDNFYQTPAEFFTRASGGHYIADRQGHAHKVVPSSFQTILREIPTVGNIRLRYPVIPTHQEGNAIYKELDALKELVMNMAVNTNYFHNKPDAVHSIEGNTNREEHYRTSSTAITPPGNHAHEILLSADDISDLEAGKTVAVYTSLNNGHQHVLEVYADKNIHYRQGHYKIALCDGKQMCWDGHSNVLYYVY
ncbi:uncharacterized protein LOC110453945 [Mizuhopecten yessoensis]|uniref:uncharacterized protein LOC110453945 n=1 Tax=Mizuhopecten yessoensis TaxID=6573 RepID=UPI000B458AC5|nr:uncharacterized protein LOC110453945 [Mizuhopecten yessoensis]